MSWNMKRRQSSFFISNFTNTEIESVPQLPKREQIASQFAVSPFINAIRHYISDKTGYVLTFNHGLHIFTFKYK